MKKFINIYVLFAILFFNAHLFIEIRSTLELE